MEKRATVMSVYHREFRVLSTLWRTCLVSQLLIANSYDSLPLRYAFESDEVDYPSYVISQAFFYGPVRGATAVAAASTTNRPWGGVCWWPS